MTAIDLSHLVDLTEGEVLDCLGIWKSVVMDRHWDVDDELAYVLVTSLVREHFESKSDYDADGFLKHHTDNV